MTNKQQDRSYGHPRIADVASLCSTPCDPAASLDPLRTTCVLFAGMIPSMLLLLTFASGVPAERYWTDNFLKKRWEMSYDAYKDGETERGANLIPMESVALARACLEWMTGRVYGRGKGTSRGKGLWHDTM